jgi:hypothetical protein
MRQQAYFDSIEDAREFRALLEEARDLAESSLSLKELDFNNPTLNQDFEIAEYGEEYAY